MKSKSFGVKMTCYVVVGCMTSCNIVIVIVVMFVYYYSEILFSTPVPSTLSELVLNFYDIQHTFILPLPLPFWMVKIIILS